MGDVVMDDGGGSVSHGWTRHTAGCTCAKCAGFQPGNELSLRHGVYATRSDRIRPVARAQKRRLLRWQR